MTTETNLEPFAEDFPGVMSLEEHGYPEREASPDLNFLRNILVFYNQFFYLTYIPEFRNVYVSSQIREVLGYAPNDFLSVDQVYEAIHPEDRAFVYEFSLRTIHCSRIYAGLLLQNPLCAVFSIDFRIRTSQGTYIRVNRQSCCYRTDPNGNMLYAISFFTDISHLKKSNLITYAWWGNNAIRFDIEDLVNKYNKKILTHREMEIICQISQGFTATQIAQMLFISKNTVIKHRKNILHKLQAKNTAQLIKRAVEMGLV